MKMRAPKKFKKKVRTGTAAFAEKELRDAGLFNKDSDYNGMIGDAVMELMDVFSKQGHSGYSASMTRQLFDTLSNWTPITPLKNPTITKEYIVVDEDTWQSTRDSSVFSMNQGKTWYHLDAEPTLFNKIMKFLYWNIGINRLYRMEFISKKFRNQWWDNCHKTMKFEKEQ